MYLFAPTYAPKMTESHQPRQSGLTQPAMAAALKLPHVKPIHATEHTHLRTPVAKPLHTPVLTPLPPPPPPVRRDRVPGIEPHLRVVIREPLWR